MKNKIREYAKEYRKKLNTSELSSKIHENLFSLYEWKNSKNIFIYYSVGDEVNTTNLFSMNKNWFIPKISGENLLVCKYSIDNLVCNKYHIPEPQTEAVSAENMDVIIVPALAADRHGYRIGYGGGYYDRFIKSLKPDVIKVVFVYSDLLLDNIHPDKFDERCDIVITDKEVIKINC